MQLKPETLTRIDQLLVTYPQPRSSLIMIFCTPFKKMLGLFRIQYQWVAQKMGLEPIEVYEVMTFYPMFRSEVAGKYHIKVCRTLSCALAGSYKVCDELQQQLDCKLNETSKRWPIHYRVC